MPISPEQIQVARDFEPVLYFAVGEPLLPADPKRYLETSSLWRVRPPGTTPDEWGEEAAGEWPKHPMAKAKKVVGLKSEAHDDVTWLGDLLPAPGSGEDRFLSLSGWVDGVRPDVDTEARFADVDGVLAAYGGNPALGQSQPWYYAEVLAAAQVAALANDPPAGLSSTLAQKLIGLLDQPTLILYHLFFPTHREELAGCAQDNGAVFGTFAGEWGCVAVLLENGRPTYLGLSQRNAGSRDPLDDGTRLGMVVTRWDQVSVIAGFDNHPQVAVAAGTHSLYADLDSGGEVSPPSFTSTAPDPSSGSCGDVEQVEALIPPPAPTLTWEPPTEWEIALKAVVPVVGWIWAGIEIDMFYTDPFGAADPTVANPRDVPPTRNEHGGVVAPSAVPEPAAQHWPTDGVTDPSQFHADGGRTYPFVVDRAEQAWWPRPDGDGFHGRWGPAVASDPFGRRAGMRVPEFAKLFLGALSQT